MKFIPYVWENTNEIYLLFLDFLEWTQPSILRNISLLLVVILAVSCKVSKYNGEASPVSHSIWDSLLMDHVGDNGLVDYKGFIKDSVRMNEYLKLLASHHPNDEYWTEAEQLAYWINAYNAFTIKLVMDHYPVKSIKDIKPGVSFVNSVWDIKFIHIESRTYDLNNIEHGIIRKQFNEPRIHAAVNCASISCPKLQQHAYTPEKLDSQLTNATREFLADSSKNEINPDNIKISPIFKWFSGDFTKKGNLIDFLNLYSPVKINKGATIEYGDYNWELNDVK